MGNTSALQLVITLVGSEPPIWRRVIVPERMTFANLHRVIQFSMGWCNSHLHQFEVEDERLTEFEEDIETGATDSRQVKICDLGLNRKGRVFSYLYDFGDGWRHEILVEDRLSVENKGQLPLCVAGERACPPEDSGGVHGYEIHLAVREDPDHPMAEDWAGWLDPAFDPEGFDAHRVNRVFDREFGGARRSPELA
jgi:hypothetical protein